MRPTRFYVILFVLTVTVSIFVWKHVGPSSAPSVLEADVVAAEPPSPFELTSLEITEGATYGKLMEAAGISAADALAILAAAESVYDLSNVRLGRTIDLWYDRATHTLHHVVYQIDTEDELVITTSENGWTAQRVAIPYEVKVVAREGTIETSMYEAAPKAGIDERAIINLANVFQWSVDFAMDVRVGDTFRFVYEERYRDGAYVMPGRILAGKYVNDGAASFAYYFEESEENKGYFDVEGNSVQKLFLKAPVAYKYISSGFTTGRRYVQEFNVSTGHRAIDYAAPVGTPIRAVGDGTVVTAGWNGPYGNFISVRHNGTYTTNYAHLSKYAVKRGDKVAQSNTIGYVGSSGFSTGPHLHFEMVKNGVKINPLLEILPPGKAIKEENKERFLAQIQEYQSKLEGGK